MRGMIDYAIYYQQKGFSVIPISKDGKKPLVAFADKPAFTEHELRLLWKDNPDANIALRTDSFFVIDIDVHNGVDGLKNLREWEHARLIPKTLQPRLVEEGISTLKNHKAFPWRKISVLSMVWT